MTHEFTTTTERLMAEYDTGHHLILKHFQYRHLGDRFEAIGEMFACLALEIAGGAGGLADRERALTSLLSARDWALRASGSVG